MTAKRASRLSESFRRVGLYLDDIYKEAVVEQVEAARRSYTYTTPSPEHADHLRTHDDLLKMFYGKTTNTSPLYRYWIEDMNQNANFTPSPSPFDPPWQEIAKDSTLPDSICRVCGTPLVDPDRVPENYCCSEHFKLDMKRQQKRNVF